MKIVSEIGVSFPLWKRCSVIRWFQKRCYRFSFPKRCSQNRCREIGVTVSPLKRWSRKSVLPNLVVSNRSYEIGALVSLLKRDPNFVFLNSVFRFFHENGVPKFGDLNRCYRFSFPKRCSQDRCHEIGVPSSLRKRCSEIRCLKFGVPFPPRKRCPEIR